LFTGVSTGRSSDGADASVTAQRGRRFGGEWCRRFWLNFTVQVETSGDDDEGKGEEHAVGYLVEFGGDGEEWRRAFVIGLAGWPSFY